MDSECEQFNENVNAEVVSSDVIRPASPGRKLPRCALCCYFISSTDKPVNIIISDRSREIATKYTLPTVLTTMVIKSKFMLHVNQNLIHVCQDSIAL